MKLAQNKSYTDRKLSGACIFKHLTILNLSGACIFKQFTSLFITQSTDQGCIINWTNCKDICRIRL